MSASPKVSTPVSVGRFVASVRSVAASTDGLARCGECGRAMSDMADTCPHCDTAVTDRAIAAPLEVADMPEGATEGMTGSDARSMALLVLALVAGAYVIARIAGW